MAQKILVIGGVALGPKAACRCKRLMPDAEITLVDENLFISYGGCGIPYYVSGEVNNLDDLRATPYHTVRDPEFFRTMKGITVRNQTRAMAIDRAAKTLLVRNVVTGEEEKLPYDKLVLATGATPRMPPVEGHDLKNVLTLTRQRHRRRDLPGRHRSRGRRDAGIHRQPHRMRTVGRRAQGRTRLPDSPRARDGAPHVSVLVGDQEHDHCGA